MLTLAKALFLGLATVNAYSNINQPGAGISISKVGINNAKDVAVPYIFNLIKDISIPEVLFKGGSLTDLAIHLPQPPVSNIGIQFDPTANGVTLLANGVTATVSSNFKYSYFITVTGEAAIKVNKMGIDIEVDISEQAVGEEKAIKLHVAKSDIIVDPTYVDITLTGGLAAKIAGYLVPVLKKSVIPQVIKIVEKAIVNIIDVDVNKDLYEYGTHLTVKELGYVTADFAQMSTPAQITQDHTFEMSINATYFDAHNVKASVYPAPVAFSMRNPNGRSLQAHLTEWNINTALEAAYSTGNTLDICFYLKKYLNITLTTTNVGIFVPEVITKYGKDVAINLSGKFITKPSYAHATAGHGMADVWIAITGVVNGEEVWYAENQMAGADLDLSTDSTGHLLGKFNKISVGTITPGTFRTTLPGVTSTYLNNQQQALVGAWMAQANIDLASGYALPSILGIQGVVEIAFSNGKVELGVDATPTAWEGIGAMITNFKSMVRYSHKMEQIAKINAMLFA